MGAPLHRVRVRAAWVLVWAAVALLGAVGYGVYVAVKLATAETTPSFVTGPDDFAGRVGLVLQFNGSGPLVLLLLAGVLLAGCLVLAGRVPAQLAGRAQGRPVGGSRLRLSVLGLAALAALFALGYGVAALGVLTTTDDTLEEEAFRLLNRSNLVTVLAVSVAAVGVLSLVVLSSWFSGDAPVTADEQPDDAAGAEPAAEPPEADTVQVPLPSSPDLLDSGPAVGRGRRRHPTDRIATEGPGGERS